MKLTNQMRTTIVDRIIASARAPREAALNHREAALAIMLLRHRYGDDVFERCRALPEGWLHHQKQISLEYGLVQTLPRTSVETGGGRHRSFNTYPRGYLSLTDHAPLPQSASGGWDRKAVGDRLYNELHILFGNRIALEDDLKALRTQISGILAAFTTVKCLADGWPEGYAHLPAEMTAPLTANLPAVRIADLNARIEALKEVA
jgi:hypothetical protein